ncbi:MAG: glutamate--tRNA ligase family protein [Bacteroidota bacterium]
MHRIPFRTFVSFSDLYSSISYRPLTTNYQLLTTVPARLAPTPSGFLHFGNAANFALNALLAQRTDGRLLLRIDDLDRGRFREEYLAEIFRVIDWLELTVTDGPRNAADFHARWSQEHRMPEYEKALEELSRSPLVFGCPCSRKELATGRHAHGCLEQKIDLAEKGVAWRINTRQLAEYLHLPDLVRAKPFTIRFHEEMPDFAIRKKDGRPSYQLACTVDDVLFGITHVGRGEDLLASTAVQAVLSDLLGYEPLFKRIQFVHHPLVEGVGGEKLSKSAGAEGVAGLSEIYPEQVFALANSWIDAKQGRDAPALTK